MRRYGYKIRSRKMRPENKYSRLFDLVVFALVVILSPVLLIPFYMAAHSVGGIAMFGMLLITGAIYFFGLRHVMRRANSIYSEFKNQ